MNSCVKLQVTNTKEFGKFYNKTKSEGKLKRDRTMYMTPATLAGWPLHVLGRCEQAINMRNKLIISILVIIWLCSCGQRRMSKREKVTSKSEVKATGNINIKLSQNPTLEKYIYTDTTYAVSTGKGITIQNSFPKGGMIEPDGTKYSDPREKNTDLRCFGLE